MPTRARPEHREIKINFSRVFCITQYNIGVNINELEGIKGWANGGTGRRVGLKIQ